MALEVVSQSAVAADPAEGTLDNPLLRQHDEAVSVTAADDLQCPPTRPRHRRVHLRALASASPITLSRTETTGTPAAAAAPHRHGPAHWPDGRLRQAGRAYRSGCSARADRPLPSIVAGWVKRRLPLRRLCRLTTDDCSRRVGRAPDAFALSDVERSMVPSHYQSEKSSQTVHFGGRSFGNACLSAAGREHAEDHVQHCVQGHHPRSAALGRPHHR